MRLFLGSALFLLGLALMYLFPAVGVSMAMAAAIVDDPELTEELKALNAIKKQLTESAKTLGDKADKKDFDDVNKALKELKDGLKDWTGEKIETKMKEVNDGLGKISKQLEEAAEDIAKSKESGKGKKKGQFITAEQVKAFIDATFKDGRKTKDSAAIELKAAETFGYPEFFEGGSDTDITAFTGRFIDPTLYQRKRKRNLILDNFAIETIGFPTLLFLIKVEIGSGGESDADAGGADWIVSGAPKPKRSFRVTTGTVDAKKVAIFGTVEDKLLRDVPSLQNWIQEDFSQEMKEEINDGLLNNNPSVDPDAPLGLKQNAIQYSATPAFAAQVDDPNYIDAIMAVAAYMASLHERPSKVFVSDDVFYAMLILKDNESRYQSNPLVYTNSLGQLYIGGVQVVPSDAEDVPSTHILAISEDLGFKIKAYGPMVFERGLNGEDFREDKTSFRGYQEFLSYIPEHRYNSVLYDTFANILAAIAGS